VKIENNIRTGLGGKVPLWHRLFGEEQGSAGKMFGIGDGDGARHSLLKLRGSSQASENIESADTELSVDPSRNNCAHDWILPVCGGQYARWKSSTRSDILGGLVALGSDCRPVLPILVGVLMGDILTLRLTGRQIPNVLAGIKKTFGGLIVRCKARKVNGRRN
jgi:hypothetical protein